MFNTKDKKKTINPTHRIFQRSDLSSFTSLRRQKFLILRKQNRESYFENVRKVLLNSGNNSDNDNDDNSKDFDFSLNINKFTQYPLNDNDNNSINNDINNNTNSNSNNNNSISQLSSPPNPNQAQSVSASSNKNIKIKKKRKRKKNKNKNNKNNNNNNINGRELRMKYVEMFMIHEWMNDIPNDINTNWMVGLRAEGERCLVFAASGQTFSRNRTGNFVHKRFPSLLPSGNISLQKKSNITVLDCIFVRNIRTYYVIDCILWNNQKIGLSDAQMRLWFIYSKINDEIPNIKYKSKYNKFKFKCIKTYDVNCKNLNYLYNGGDFKNDDKNNNNNNMHPDGLIFYHKFGCYVCGISCPLILIWKDNVLSRWFIDTSNRQNKINQNKLLQFINLKINKNGTITPHDNDIVLSIMSPHNIISYNLRANDLLRFSITSAGYNNNECFVSNLLFIKKCSKSKMLADTWSKIMFQNNAKNNKYIKFNQIINYIKNINQNNNNNNISIDDDIQLLNDDNNNTNIDDYLTTATIGLESFHL